ncbi:hypothetical protein ACFQZ4_16105 [Catellatospora coxensis]
MDTDGAPNPVEPARPRSPRLLLIAMSVLLAVGAAVVAWQLRHPGQAGQPAALPSAAPDSAMAGTSTPFGLVVTGMEIIDKVAAGACPAPRAGRAPPCPSCRSPSGRPDRCRAAADGSRARRRSSGVGAAQGAELVQLGQHAVEMADLLVGMQRGQLHPETDLTPGHQRVRGERDVHAAPPEQAGHVGQVVAG